jgi:hypothetical protein
MPLFSRGWVVVGAVVVSLPWLAIFFRRGLRDLHRIPGFVAAARAEPQPEGAEQAASAAAAAPAPQPEPEPVVIADEPEAKA